MAENETKPRRVIRGYQPKRPGETYVVDAKGQEITGARAEKALKAAAAAEKSEKAGG